MEGVGLIGFIHKPAGHCRNGRVLRPELLGSASEAEASENLRDLQRLNRWAGARWILQSILSRRVRRDEPFTMLDVGSASGDVASAVTDSFPGARVCSLDRRPFHVAKAPLPKVVGDAFALPFHPRSFDLVSCSLLLHEFPDREVVSLLRGLHKVARRCLVIIELYRHPIPYHFLPATRRLFGWGALTVHDGPASVEAGFLPSELESLAAKAGVRRAKVRRHLPWFRVSLVADHEASRAHR
jgi:methyltransferase family protein